ncbi:MAE_28990/MAE_18760 family HEPN-like nuclease [Lacticaseibacillus absianus]|uniref:MAE_28990/MAE_18760 family HEPN-like nuclease n=1 Tax=Lacticaseibacillus absianus TaxID=2729623 RepID=UPI0015CA88ED|nr:MAE_28990/MAE_18760 family HEPN-like nuclease [Lacticaseibacillus absianus]
MKVKNIETLQDKIDREMFWRREEIIRLNIRANQPSENATVLRAGYLLLYSSWEGFIRSIANLYVVFVFSRDISLHDLRDGFQAVYFQQSLSKVRESPSSAQLQEFMREIHSKELERPTRKLVDTTGKRFINTDSNLNFKRLDRIISVLELPLDFSLKKEWIDRDLLMIRNKIAHGERSNVDVEMFNETVSHVLEMMDLFSEGVMTAAETELYRRDSLA